MKNNNNNNFIKQIIKNYLLKNKNKKIITRFPPEPNGYLHIGHAKSIFLNFNIAKEFKGKFHIRFDDTNPKTETLEFVKNIIKDIQWLGFKSFSIKYSSNYYHKLYKHAIYLIKSGKAYVDSLSPEEIQKYRGTINCPGTNSPYRNRSISENLSLFLQMKSGKFPNGSHVLRAKINMKSPNINLRDPILYRICHTSHQKTKKKWCIYPMYDYAQPISDSIENITHSLCTLEFQDHKKLYNWFIKNLPNTSSIPTQIEFSKLSLTHTLTSKRKIKFLIKEKIVSGWNDPRLPTICGMRKRGYPPSSIKQFCESLGISKSESIIDYSVLEQYVRNDLNKTAKRAFCVINPLKIIITNYPNHKIEKFDATYYPQKKYLTKDRIIPFSKELYIEKNDFIENPPKKYFRLSMNNEVRLKYSYTIRCTKIIRNKNGEIIELHCIYDKNSLKNKIYNKKNKGIIHWVSIAHAHKVNIIQYNKLFTNKNPNSEKNFLKFLNPYSMTITTGWCEPSLANQPINEIFQFERIGYYQVKKTKLNKTSIFHRIVDLKNKWNIQKGTS
ncbi:glutamine--tRNA ligase [Candidatus Legionella polyplacis]|uniref:glutamine--tRNA ligase/YqeY domain fusion protein n=1 Tax=Candidatus Legionella polyplacis TaxID=2005262 RepID=UPI000C1ECE55|nr:glutamine--tRNA ligase/YqeY domain fusion protein [Candidatus Legionella polyplacis]ATW01918.1 glutamine--tRNA ligase [Candidatus Legionella polyplacis]